MAPRDERPGAPGAPFPLTVGRILVLALLVSLFLAATVPHLADYPEMTADQTGIAAPAWKLASTGVYGNDLYAGFFRTEELNYEYLPLYPLLVAASYRLFGLGVVPARAVSVACGVLVLLLVFAIGQRISGTIAGLVAAGSLVLLRLGVSGGGSGVPLVDLSRVIRYDVLVPVLVLGSALLLLEAERAGRGHFLAGACLGLAVLAQFHGAFFVVPVLATLAASRGVRVLVSARVGAFLCGSALAVLPWIVFVLRDPGSWAAQMARHGSRVPAGPAFLLKSLSEEGERYAPWLRSETGHARLFPRPGMWLVLGALCVLLVLVARRAGCSAGEARGRALVLASVVLLPFCLGLFVSFKRYPYVLLVLPFLALAVGISVSTLWRISEGRWPLRLFLGAFLLAAAAEGVGGLADGRAAAREAPSYLGFCERIARFLPPGERVLGIHHYWLGLAGYEFRSLDLVKVLSEDRYPHRTRRTLSGAIDFVDPGSIVVSEDLLREGVTEAYGQRNPSACRFWRDLSAYLALRCARTGVVSERVYGTVGIYRRIRSGGSAPPASGEASSSLY